MNTRASEKKLLVPAVSMMLLLCNASEQKTEVSEQHFKCFFKSIAYDGTNYVFTQKRGYAYRVDNSSVKVCKDGEVIQLPPESVLEVFEHHCSLTVLPLPSGFVNKGFVLSLKTDLRSFGGNVTTNYAYLINADDKSDSSEEGSRASDTNAVARTKAIASTKEGVPEKRFLKGLKLLLCK